MFVLFVCLLWDIKGSARVVTAVWMHYLDANKTAGEEA